MVKKEKSAKRFKFQRYNFASTSPFDLAGSHDQSKFETIINVLIVYDDAIGLIRTSYRWLTRRRPTFRMSHTEIAARHDRT
jgi:hypothetical protein